MVTLTATVSSKLGAVPTGTVEFKEGNATIGTAPVGGTTGTATLTIAALDLCLKNGDG